MVTVTRVAANPAVEMEMSVSKTARVAGIVLSALPVLFLTVDGVMKLLLVDPVVKASAELGLFGETPRIAGIILLACLALHLVKRTSILGAVLLTGFLGGAVAIHLQQGSPLPTHVLFPVYLGAFLWAGLWLRDARVRALVSRVGGCEE